MGAVKWQVLRINAYENAEVSPRTEVHLLDWGVAANRESVSQRCFDVVVASDVIYEEQNVEPFIRTLQSVWEASAIAFIPVHCILALKKRDLASEVLNEFFRQLEEGGFQQTEVGRLFQLC